MATPSDDSMDTSDSTSTTQTSDSNSGVSQPQNSPQVPLLAAGIQSTPTSSDLNPTAHQNQSQHPPLQATAFQSPEFYSSLLQAPLAQEQLVALLRAGFKSPGFYSLLPQILNRDQLVALLSTAFQHPDLQQFLHKILSQDQLTQLQPFDFQHVPGFYSLLLQILNRDQLVALLSAAFQHPEFYSSLLQIMNEEQVVALLSAAFQPPEFYSHLLQILSRDQLVAMLSTAFQSMQTPPNIPSGLHQFQNQPQLVALQGADLQHMQTPPASNPGVSQNQIQFSDSQHAAQQAAGFQHMQTSPDSNSGVYQNQNPDFRHAAQHAAAFQHTQTTPDSNSAVSQNQNPDSQHAVQQASDPQHMQTPPNIPLDMNQFQNQPQLVVLQAPGFQHMQSSPDSNSGVYQNQNSDFRHAAQHTAAFQHTQTTPDSNSAVSQNQNPDSQHAVQQPADPQHTQTPPDLNSGVSQNQNQNPDPQHATQQAAALQDVNSHVNPPITKQPGKVQDDLRDRTACSKTNSRELSMNESSQTLDIYTSGDEGAAGGAEPSAPLDTAKVSIRVEWTEEIPSRWRVHLQKALQSWSSGTLSKHVGEDCNVMNLWVLDDPVHAVAEISPSRALDVLKKLKTETLTFKELKCSTTVHFLVDETKHLESQKSVPPVEEKEDNMDLNKSEKNNKEAAAAARGDPNGAETPQHADRSGDPPALTVPIPQFWYFSHAFRKELRQFEAQWGVRVNAEVSVSIKAEDPSRRDSVQEAAQKFTDFYQENTRSLKSAKIPQTQLESEYVKEVVRNVQIDQTKMMLNLSAGQCQLFGPGPVISTVQKQMNLESHMETGRSSSDDRTNMETDFSNAEGRSWTSQTAKPVEMDIRDSSDPIVMNETHWQLIQKTSQKQIQDIEIKYGVLITAAPSQGSVKVTVKSNNEHVNLESHALRAFTHLYQKVTTTAVACSLKHPAEGKTVAQALGKLSCPDYFVGIEEKHGVWKLVGLPKHLGPVITEIEKLVGKSVFDDKTKELVGYPGNFPESWGLRGGQQELAAAKRTHGITPDSGNQAKNGSGKDIKEKDDDKSKDDDCPICMDKFTDKRKLKCGHEFCRACLNEAVKNMGEICPVCKNIFGKLVGTQPDGNMNVHKQSYSLPGYPHCGTIEIFYSIPDGKQTERHPNPGQSFYGAHRQAYLPDNAEGREVLKLLQRAFDQRLIFTVGTSSTSGMQNTVTWNDIHHKTSPSGGPQRYGYPDPDYLKRVKEELKAKGIE